MRGSNRVVLILGLLTACGPTTGGGGDDIDAAATGAVDDDGDSYTETEGDCNDADPTIHPGATESCTDAIDNDCDGAVDANDYVCMTPCQRAEFDRSSVGCVYYGVDTNSLGGPYALAVSNVDPTLAANVVVEMKTGTTWAAVAGGTFTIPARSLNTITVPRRFTTGTALYAGGAYRITSDLPVIAYQFAPIDGSASFLSDASLLLPVSALDEFYILPAWPYGRDVSNSLWPAHLQIAASAATTVTITSPVASLGGTGVPALAPNVPTTITMQDGDYLQFTVQNENESFSGAYIEASAPVAVFSSNDCANVPNTPSACCCEHLEEQIFGLQTWGTSYVGAQMPRRGTEPSVWQILAQQDGTVLTFTGAAGVTGFPTTPVTLMARQQVEYQISGTTTPGDFLVTATKPILVNQYTVGSTLVVPATDQGDPDMVQAIPTEQYLAHYVVLVPATWINDFVVLIRQAGEAIMLDGAAPTTTWNPIGATGWETASVPLTDGVHVLDSNTPFGVTVSGYDQYDSYSYPGGLNQTLINPVE